MPFIAYGELTPLSWGLIGVALLFTLQLLLCFKAQKKAIKFIPIYLILLGFLICGMTYMGLFGSYPAGAISGNGLVALIFVFIIGVAATGVLFAWLVYGATRILKRISSKKKG